jgi:two-component system response regulator HydG
METSMTNSIIVVDGDTGVVNAFKATLPRWGFAVAGFASMALGFAALKEEQACALILDIQLPKSRSIALLREAKKLYPSLPIITMTAYSTSFTEAEALCEGADGYFVKPIDLDALVQKLKTVTNGAKMSAEKAFLFLQ